MNGGLHGFEIIVRNKNIVRVFTHRITLETTFDGEMLKAFMSVPVINFFSDYFLHFEVTDSVQDFIKNR